MNRFLIIIVLPAVLLMAGSSCRNIRNAYPFRDASLPMDERVEDLLSRLTLQEKISLLNVTGPEITRLGIPAYHYGNEALHGVVRPGKATVFPQAIGLAATWDTDLMYTVATAISDEARAKDNANNGRMTGAEELGGRFNGLLTFFSPTVNMARDPRWGRTAETYGEDPLLTSRMGVAFIRGMQGEDPRYLKTICTPKHFVANNEEHNRFSCNVITTEENLRNYYLKGFEACVREAGAGAVMTAYNAINGIPCSVNTWLIRNVLRQEWGFGGYVVTDCGAVKHLFESHGFVKDTVGAAALAINSGVDLECGPMIFPRYLGKAVERGLVTEGTINGAVRHVLLGRFRLGLYDPAYMQPYRQILVNVVDSDAHRELALRAALESMVLLKNESQGDRGTADNQTGIGRAGGRQSGGQKLLPLNADLPLSIAVVGPNADICRFGDYSGVPVNPPVSPLQGLQNRVPPNIRLVHVPWSGPKDEMSTEDRPADSLQGITPESLPGMQFKAEIDASANADVVVAFMGLGDFYERESVDKEDLDLPPDQEKFIRLLHGANHATIVVLINGSPLSVNWIDRHIPAIIEAWYPGEQGGTAIASVLFGDYNPAGRLPLTFYKGVEQLPAFDEYEISRGRTYMYLAEDPLYPFGHGLSYTDFAYSDLRIDRDQAGCTDTLRVSLRVSNTGHRDGDEVVQLYAGYPQSKNPLPRKVLVGFQRVHIRAGETRVVEFKISLPRLLGRYSKQEGQFTVPPGRYGIYAGASSTDIRLKGDFNIIE